MLPSRTTRTVA
jgi:hypothetical protein